MKLSIIAALTSLATLISAAPVEKRVVVYTTVFDKVVETVDVYTTVIVKGGYRQQPAPVVPTSTTPVASPPVSTPSSEPAPSLKPVEHSKQSKPKPFTPPAPVSTPPAPVSSPPAPGSIPPAPVSTPPAPVSSPPAPVSTPPAPVSSPPAPVYTPPAPVSSPVVQAPPPSTPESSGGSGTQYSGDLTFYEAGLGSCGIVNDGSTEKVFALAHGKLLTCRLYRGVDADPNILGMMEAQHAANPNLNPLCGKLATVYLEGKSVIVKLVDTCANCVSLFPLQYINHAEKTHVF